MSDRQILIFIAGLSVLMVILVIELSDTLTKDDIVEAIAFLAGAGFVIAFMRGGPKK